MAQFPVIRADFVCAALTRNDMQPRSQRLTARPGVASSLSFGLAVARQFARAGHTRSNDKLCPIMHSHPLHKYDIYAYMRQRQSGEGGQLQRALARRILIANASPTVSLRCGYLSTPAACEAVAGPEDCHARIGGAAGQPGQTMGLAR